MHSFRDLGCFSFRDLLLLYQAAICVKSALFDYWRIHDQVALGYSRAFLSLTLTPVETWRMFMRPVLSYSMRI